MSWWRVSVGVPPELADAAAATLARATGLAVEIRDATTMSASESPDAAEVVLGTEQSPGDALVDALAAALADLGLADAPIRTQRSDDETWRTGWRAFFRGTRLSRRVAVRPPWESAAAEPPISVVIDPGQAFGSGHHATTRGVMRRLDDLLAQAPGATVLDVGCGSAILSIAAALLGSPAVGVEIDPVALENARENLGHNGVSDRVRLVLGGPSAITDRFDLVVANILAPILVQIAPDLAPRCRRDLLLSGLTERDLPAVRAAYAAFDEVDARAEEEWIVLHLRVPR